MRLRREQLQGGSLGAGLSRGRLSLVGGLPLAGPAEAAVLRRIGFPAVRADNHAAPAALAEKLGAQGDSLPPQEVVAGLPDLGQQEGRILCLFGAEFKIPVINFGEVNHPGRVQEDPHPFPLVFVVQGEGKAAQVDQLEPAVADGAGGEQLDGVRQAMPGF